MITQLEDEPETAMAEQNRHDSLNTQFNSKGQSQPQTKRLHLLTSTSVDLRLRSSIEASVASGVSTKKSRKTEKTLLKVMDPNVHQMVINPDIVNQQSGSDDEYVPSESDPIQKHQQILNGIVSAPKLEMQKKISRQSELIRSLQNSKQSHTAEIQHLKERLAKKDAKLEQMRDSLTSVKIFSSIKTKSVVESDDESEIEEDVKQQIREQGRVDTWRQDDTNYYSSLMPNRRQGRKQQLLALMPASIEDQPNEQQKTGLMIEDPTTSVFKLSQLENQVDSDKKQRMIKPELDTGLSKQSKLRLKQKSTGKRTRQAQDIQRTDENLKAIVPVDHYASIEVGGTLLENSPHQQMKAIKSMHALSQMSDEKTGYKLQKVDQSFKKGERAVGSKIKGVRQMVEPVVARYAKDVEKGVQPDRAFEPNSRNQQLQRQEASPGGNFTTKKKIQRPVAVQGTHSKNLISELQVQGQRKRQVSSHSTKDIVLRNGMSALDKPNVHEYSVQRGHIPKFSQIDASSAKISEGFQQYALDLDSKQDSNFGPKRHIYKENFSFDAEIPYQFKGAENKIPTKNLHRESSQLNKNLTQKIDINKAMSKHRSESQGIIVPLHYSNQFRTVDVSDSNESKYHQILAKRNARALGITGTESLNQLTGFDSNEKLSSHHKKQKRREDQNRSMHAVHQSLQLDPYSNDPLKPQVHLPHIQQQQSRAHSSTPQLSGGTRLNKIALRENSNLKRVKAPKLKLPTLNIQKVVL